MTLYSSKNNVQTNILRLHDAATNILHKPVVLRGFQTTHRRDGRATNLTLRVAQSHTKLAGDT